MSKWSIRNHLLLLALLPALLAAICLTIYFTYSQLNQISIRLDQAADVALDHMSVTSEYALFSGNTTELERISERIMQNRSIVSITVYDDSGSLLMRSTNTRDQIDTGKLQFYENRLIEQRRDIIASETPLGDLGVIDAADTPARRLGWIEMVLTNQHYNQLKTRTVIRSFVITLGILCISGLIGLAVSRRIANPVLRLTEIVRRISSGRLDMRADVAAPAELGVLEEHINRMADDLQEAQDIVEERIERVTEELEETMEELEIRNAQLDISRSRAQQANAAKSEFLASMSHEIRTPLSGIIGFSELLEQSGLPPREHEYASTIRSSSRLLLGIIEEILDISKIESGKIKIVNDSCDIRDIFDRVFVLLHRAAVDKGIELFHNIDADVPRYIVTDAMRVQQVLMNLVSNAIKFTSEGQVRIQVSRDGDSIRFAVHDTGIGLDEQASKKLFNAFTQADETISREYGGTGLGLVISRKLTQLMQGDIGFESTPGEGSEFWFTLPLTESAEPLTADDDRLDGLRIAVVGDHQGTMEALMQRIGIWGPTISSLQANSDTLTRMQEVFADVIIVSIAHGEDTDLYADLIWHLHQDLSDAPIMVLTSAIDEALDRSLCASGADTLSPRYLTDDKLLRTLCGLTGRASPEPAKEIITDHRVSGRGVRSLIVDDNITNLKLASIVLSKSGIAIATATSGVQALELCREQRFDIIFLDIQMPGMDGYETVRRIRQETLNESTEIIALTAHMMPEEKQHALDCGFDSVVIKPVSEDIVNRVLTDRSRNVDPVTQKTGKLNNTAFDPQEALQLASGNENLARKMTTIFVEQLPGHRQELLDTCDDLQRLKSSVHKLHGATQYVGAPRLRRAIDGFERQLDALAVAARREALDQVIAEIDGLMTQDLQMLLLSISR